VRTVDAKITPELQLRALIEKFGPKDQKLIRAVRSAIRNGPRLPDPKKLLMGTGKQARFIPVKAAGELAHPEVEALIVAAIDQASAQLPSTGQRSLVIKPTAASRRR
jgi:hypothetical protein